MLTRCPECQTQFRITPEQVSQAGGTVRCGVCHWLCHAGHTAADYGAVSMAPPAAESDNATNLRWLFGVALLILILPLQVAWWDRHALSATAQGQVWFSKLCSYLPCQLVAPRHPEHIAVLERSLSEPGDPPGALRFYLLMESRHRLAQAYPVIELSLLDAIGRRLGARRFRPEEYLPSDAGRTQRLAPQTPVAISLDLAPLQNHSVGFQIDFL